MATPFPSGLGYASLTKLISGSFGYLTFAQNLHYGVHNSIHNAAGSTMGTLSTSADPIFYNHHATIDLVHQMWYDYQMKRPMTETEKKNSAYGFATCSQSPSIASPSRLANITQFWSSGASRTRADDHPVLGAFFSPLPTEYWQYVSSSDLGDYSYTYEKGTLLQSFADANTAISCPAVSKARRAQEVVPGWQQPRALWGVSRDAVREKAVGQIKGFMAKLTSMVVAAIKASNQDGSSATTSEVSSEAVDQMELMECAWYVEQGNYVDDLTDEYRTNMNIPSTVHTVCYNLIMKLLSGDESIDVHEWRKVFKAYLFNFVSTPTSTNSVVTSTATSSGALSEEAGVLIGDTDNNNNKKKKKKKKEEPRTFGRRNGIVPISTAGTALDSTTSS